MKSVSLKQHSTTEGGRRKILEWMNNQSRPLFLSKRDDECWSLYNNTGDNKEFEYLTKIGEYELPSKLRRIPIQRAKANALISQQSLRPIKQSSSIIDEDGKKEAMQRIFQTIVSLTAQTFITKNEMHKGKLRQLDKQKEVLMSQMQQLSQSEEPAAQAQLQRMQEFLPEFEMQYNIAREMMEMQVVMSEKEKENIKTFVDADYHDVEEIIADKLLQKYIKLLKIHDKALENMINKIVTGREFYLVDFKPGDDEPTFEAVNGQKVIYPVVESEGWTHNLPWVILEDYMTKEQIRKNFNLNTKELNALEALDEEYYQSYNDGNFIAGPGNIAIDNPDNAGKKKYAYNFSGIRVKRVWWRTDHEIKAVKSPNKHDPDLDFYNVIPDKEVIDLKLYYYDKVNDQYVNKKDSSDVKPKDSVYVYNSTKGQRVIKKYYDKRYKGFIIGNRIFHSEEDPIQPRMQDDFKTIPLPIVGRSFNKIGQHPYSIIWATSELQKEYWVVNYHKELTFALAGASGVVFDMSQKPDGMSKDEWFYHMKLGRYLIQTISKTGAKKNTGYNQFSRVDQTLPQSIQYFDAILERLDYQIGMIMGVPRQRLGEVLASDQVGTFEMANEQATLSTEIIYHEHDEVLVEALTLLINIATQYVVKPNEVISLEGDSMKFMRIPLSFGARRFNVILQTSVKKERDLVELKRIALQLADKGQIETSFIFDLFTIDSLKELKLKLDNQVKTQQEIAMLSAQNEQQALEQAREKEQMRDMQFQEGMKMIDAKLQEAELKLKAADGERDFALGSRKLDIEENKVSGEQQVKVVETMETGRKNSVDEKLRHLELMLEAALKSTGVSRGIDVSGQ